MVPHWKRRPGFFCTIPFYFAISFTDQSCAFCKADLAFPAHQLPMVFSPSNWTIKPQIWCPAKPPTSSADKWIMVKTGPISLLPWNPLSPKRINLLASSTRAEMRHKLSPFQLQNYVPFFNRASGTGVYRLELGDGGGVCTALTIHWWRVGLFWSSGMKTVLFIKDAID